MTLYDLIQQAEFDNVFKELLISHSEKSNFHNDYLTVFNSLKNRDKPNSTSEVAILVHYGYNKNIIVDGISKNTSQNDDKEIETSLQKKQQHDWFYAQYPIEFYNWNEWLTFTINKHSLSRFSNDKIIAHCLYELTLFSFNESFGSVSNLFDVSEDLF